ncbi:ABC transporter permease [Nonomuraea sp. NPDC050310]|uniref:ABC transporter permease n=1 Tax=Nonomuraea sp. NPDC050310 TaxID=3154935 RepID=UPI0033C1F566
MSESAGVIHDIGYRHYDGPRLGSGYATRALFAYSLRGIFGLGRPARSKVIPIFLALVMLLPAVVSIAILAMVKQRTMEYTQLAVFMQPVLAIFLASQSPTVVAPDLRYKVLPLYLSRPVTVVQYVVAKLAAMTLALFLLIGVPLTLMYVGELLVDLPGPPETMQYVAAMVSGLLLSVLLAALGLLLASLTPRRGLGVASVIAVYLLTSAVAVALYGAFESLGRMTAASWAVLVNPVSLVDAVRVWLFGGGTAGMTYPDGPGPALIALALIVVLVGGLALRYRKAAAR